MKTKHNTVLITGGSAGIGFEIARLFAQQGNQVIITGRDADRLQRAVAQLPNTSGIVSDVSQPADVDRLVTQLQQYFPTLNLVVNNAGRAFAYTLSTDGINAMAKATEEITTNYLAIIGLTEKLLPLLKQQPEAALVNVSSIVAFVPGSLTATYSASKAALHSYTQALRYTLAKDTSIKVFELMPPLVNTDFSQEIGGANGISPTLVAEALLQGLETDTFEIHVGNTVNLYKLFLSSPADALLTLNNGR
ncbi:SDR family NAD(P)-dependent oxidoreductase [Larkinella harenae]